MNWLWMVHTQPWPDRVNAVSHTPCSLLYFTVMFCTSYTELGVHIFEFEGKQLFWVIASTLQSDDRLGKVVDYISNIWLKTTLKHIMRGCVVWCIWEHCACRRYRCCLWTSIIIIRLVMLFRAYLLHHIFVFVFTVLIVMNEWCIYIVLYCVLLYTQNAL